jgi:hypothetical protein
MTTTTQSNTVFGIGIHLDIVYVMDVIAVLLANSASVVVAFADHLFESSIPNLWVKLSSPFATSPLCRVFSNGVTDVADPRAKLVIAFRSLFFKLFTTRLTDKGYSFLSVNVMTGGGAKLISVSCTPAPARDLFATNNAIECYIAAIPAIRLLAAVYSFTAAGIRAKARCAFPGIYNLKGFAAVFASFTNHHSTLKGASRQAGQYCCLGNTGLTGCV